MKTWNIYYDSLGTGGCILVHAKDKADASIQATNAIISDLRFRCIPEDEILILAENIEILAITFNH